MRTKKLLFIYGDDFTNIHVGEWLVPTASVVKQPVDLENDFKMYLLHHGLITNEEFTEENPLYEKFNLIHAVILKGEIIPLKLIGE
jgi:hypothetical protein